VIFWYESEPDQMKDYIYVEEAGEGSGMGLCRIGGHLLNGTYTVLGHINKNVELNILG
jgi:hypothetical protein